MTKEITFYINQPWKFLKSRNNINLIIYFNDLFKENFNDEDIKIILNNKYNDESDEKIYYYCLKIPQRLLDLKKLKEEIKNDNEKGKSFLNKLKDVIVINDFENPLLHYYNFIERLPRKNANKTIIENEIDKLKDKINGIDKKYDTFKKVWNEDFSNFTYQVEGKNKPEKIKQINSSSILIECLIDNKKESGGRQILEIYKLLLGEQNNFIQKIINNLNYQIEVHQNQSINQEINYLLEELDKKSYIQNTTERQIINIKQINVELYRTIESLIYGFSKKKCFDNKLS